MSLIERRKKLEELGVAPARIEELIQQDREWTAHRRKLLANPPPELKAMGLSTRLMLAMICSDIKTREQFLALTPEQVRRIPNLGRQAIDEFKLIKEKETA